MNSVGGEWIGMSEGSGVDRVTEGRGGYLMILALSWHPSISCEDYTIMFPMC